ncbi:MAG: DUF6695 family protein [Reichenbachiella sp.]|uniref:DUF6695 family protein n=2 Tax=Reichenbachiella sp. TaxID=2184521 RepID=UPI003266E83C
MRKQADVLPAPSLPSILDSSAQWLAGEGAGSWFVIRMLAGGQFSIKRHAPSGELECEGIFQTTAEFVASMPFTITYPSHCQTVSVIQDHRLITLNRE